MIIINKKVVHGVPLLEVAKQEFFDEKLPAIFFFHGFTSYKEVNLHYAYHLAGEGFRVILPDCEYHGERSDEKKKSFPELGLSFWQIILKAIQELEQLKDDFVGSGKVDPDKIGVVGTSMGGFITLGALTQYEWIKAAVSLMGCPAYVEFAKLAISQFKKEGHFLPFSDEAIEHELAKLSHFDLSLHPEKLNQRPLLFWHGEKDPVVPFHFAHRFYKAVKAQYKDEPEKLTFILDANAEHKVTREGLVATVHHFSTYLR